MINLNSPTIQTMINNTQNGGAGNMPVGYGRPSGQIPLGGYTNSPYAYGAQITTSERVDPNLPNRDTIEGIPYQPYAQTQQYYQPYQGYYPDPYNMITGAGLANYMPMPTYNFTGALSGNPLVSNNGVVPGYMDMNQPIMGGSFIGGGINLPIGGYTNPFMGNYGGYPGGLIGYNPERRRQELYYKYITASPEDRFAMDRGFANMKEMRSNDYSIRTKLTIMCMNGLGYDPEKIDAKKREMEEELERIENGKGTYLSANPNDPFNPVNYRSVEYRDEPVKPMHVTIVKGGQVIAEVGRVNRNISVNVRRDYELLLKLSEYKRVMEEIRVRKANKYANAPERQVDNMGLIDFFNEGFGIIHYYDRLNELNTTIKVTRLFDSEEYRHKLLEKFGPPQERRRIYRENQRYLRSRDQLEKDLERGLMRGGYGYMPDGSPVPEGLDPNIGSSFAIDLYSGSLQVTVPPHIVDHQPLFITDKYSKNVDKAREDFLRSIDNS